MKAIALNSTANANLPWNTLAGDLIDVMVNNKAVKEACDNADAQAKQKGDNMVYMAKSLTLCALMLTAGGLGCYGIVKCAQKFE